MSVVRIVGAMAVAVAAMVLSSVPSCAASADVPSFLLFGGTDLWRYAQFLYGGALWSPGGVDSGGFTGIR